MERGRSKDLLQRNDGLTIPAMLTTQQWRVKQQVQVHSTHKNSELTKTELRPTYTEIILWRSIADLLTVPVFLNTPVALCALDYRCCGPKLWISRGALRTFRYILKGQLNKYTIGNVTFIVRSTVKMKSCTHYVKHSWDWSARSMMLYSLHFITAQLNFFS